MTFRKASSRADERRTWASWVNRCANRGQRTRRDSRTDCPVWKTSPKSRSSGATNDQDHRVAKVDSPLQNAHPSPLRCIVLFVDRSQKRFVSIPDDVVHHPRRAYPGVQFHMRFSTTEFTESTENAVTTLCAKLQASIHARGEPGHSLASRHLLSRTVVEVNHALGRQVTGSRSTRASVTRQW